jgi:hypothetical protein
MFSISYTYLRVFRGLSKTTLPGYVGFFQGLDHSVGHFRICAVDF